MPRLPENPTDDDDDLFEQGTRRARRIWDGFLEFALQGNILEIAFGLM
jgi:large conductance mechanosensitive channel